MSRPLNGADSADAWVLRPYRVLVTEELGDRVWITVSAIGPNDAKGQACEEARARGYFDVTALDVREGAPA